MKRNLKNKNNELLAKPRNKRDLLDTAAQDLKLKGPLIKNKKNFSQNIIVKFHNDNGLEE